MHLTEAELHLIALNAQSVYELHEPLARKFEVVAADLRDRMPDGKGKGKERVLAFEAEVSAVAALAKCFIEAVRFKLIRVAWSLLTT